MSRFPIKITVPASTANLGPGFDSIGLAVNRYLTLIVDKANQWSFQANSGNLEGIPAGKDNLIYQVAEHIAQLKGKQLAPYTVQMESTIPLARGLGSSASAIVAGIELANQVLDLQLMVTEKVRLASLWEGHPDNVSPSIYGGLTIGTHTENETDVVHVGVPEIELVLLVPPDELKTKVARGILPEELPFRKAIRGSSVANVLVAAIFQKNWELVGKMMARDEFHQPFRGQLIPHLQDVMEYVQKNTEAYGAALSGAGPTMLCLVPASKGKFIQQVLQEQYPAFEVEILQPDTQGLHVEYVLNGRKKEIS
ncbi:homoserine kinase [Alkalihalobacillus pseudalcaliphilus]|uniref:homoserine kinase n=1 Tax=Alkalihalobacillus pseudalcaliphilus TaxID=79884 RepID=UPI00064DD694|nr:homoserine kinase [Alkalihalobacillus pseudalcaliphilus]KMK77660.1 serine kinase [Alkalihalobacillus pseudalcaliphilus]